MQSQPFGLTPVDLNTIYVTFGAGKPLTYAETGMMVSATFGHRLSERVYWPRFLRACAHGFVTLQDWSELEKHRLARIVVASPRSVEAIRDVQIALGGDYSYYRYFDPYEDYDRNPQKLDRFMKSSFTVDGQKRNISKRKLFEDHWKNHRKDPKKYRWV